MALKARLDTLDGLPDAIKSEYKEVKEGDKVTHYVLDAEGIEDVTGLKSALTKERANSKKFQGTLKKIGINPEDDAAVTALTERLGDDTIEEALEKATKAAAGADEGTKAVAKVKKLETQLKEQQDAVAAANSMIDELVRERAVRDALAEVEGNVTLMLPHLMPLVKAVEEEGTNGKKKLVAKVIDLNTKEVRMKGGKEMTLGELVEEMAAKDEFSDAFPGTGASGSGAQSQRKGTDAGGGSGTRTQAPDAVAAKKATGTYNAV